MENETQEKLDLIPVNFTIHKPDVDALDRMARASQSNRSALVREALQDWFARQKADKARRFRPAR